MNQNIPTYSALISDDNEGILVISLVDAPATETNWMCFKEQENIKFSIVNEDEHNSLSKILTARFECKPDPYIKLFKIDSRYKDNYKLYKEDCIKYGFKIQPKSLIKKILESNEYMCVGENGFAAYENDDTYIVND